MKMVYTAASRKKPSMTMEYTQKTAPSKSVSLTSPNPCKLIEARPVTRTQKKDTRADPEERVTQGRGPHRSERANMAPSRRGKELYVCHHTFETRRL